MLPLINIFQGFCKEYGFGRIEEWMDVIAVKLLVTAINKYIQKSGPQYRMGENPAPPKA